MAHFIIQLSVPNSNKPGKFKQLYVQLASKSPGGGRYRFYVTLEGKSPILGAHKFGSLNKANRWAKVLKRQIDSVNQNYGWRKLLPRNATVVEVVRVDLVYSVV